ncbi:MAG: hypothetical protein JW955_15345 [Sedimentisphaerales bacterium]|nr:hypothetical protein [Sedimentisphaerales bacterium]
MKRNGSISALIGITILTLAVASPCRGQDWDDIWWEPYIDHSETYTAANGRYGRTAAVDANWVDYEYDAYLVWAHVDARLTAWVTLDYVEDSASICASAYACGGKTWEWTGAPGEAPAMKLVHSSSVGGYVWTYGSVDDEDEYPYPTLSIESEGQGFAAVDSDEAYTEAGAYTTGWATSPRSQATAYYGYSGYGGETPSEDNEVRPGHYLLEYECYKYETGEYETAGGLSEISAAVGIVFGPSCSGSVTAAGEHLGQVEGEGGVNYAATSQVLLANL